MHGHVLLMFNKLMFYIVEFIPQYDTPVIQYPLINCISLLHNNCLSVSSFPRCKNEN